MTKPESIAIVIEFLTLVCAEGRMRDWLGEEGRSFWLPLLSLLSNRPIESPSASASRYIYDLNITGETCKNVMQTLSMMP